MLKPSDGIGVWAESQRKEAVRAKPKMKKMTLSEFMGGYGDLSIPTAPQSTHLKTDDMAPHSEEALVVESESESEEEGSVWAAVKWQSYWKQLREAVRAKPKLDETRPDPKKLSPQVMFSRRFRSLGLVLSRYDGELSSYGGPDCRCSECLSYGRIGFWAAEMAAVDRTVELTTSRVSDLDQPSLTDEDDNWELEQDTSRVSVLDQPSLTDVVDDWETLAEEPELSI